jgi:hypothetical protein
MSKDIGKFTWCADALQDIHNSFVDMKKDLPLENTLELWGQ